MGGGCYLIIVSILKLKMWRWISFIVPCVNFKMLQNYEYLTRKLTFWSQNMKGYNKFIIIYYNFMVNIKLVYNISNFKLHLMILQCHI